MGDKIQNLFWFLPRPRTHRNYKGGFPKYFEKLLIELLGHPKLILHPFGGRAEFGLRVDIKLIVKPDVVASASRLPFHSNKFDLVILDPPYSDKESTKLYGTGRVPLKAAIKESIRVLRPAGWLALYHRLVLPRPRFTILRCRIAVGVGPNHELRICQVFQKIPHKHQIELDTYWNNMKARIGPIEYERLL